MKIHIVGRELIVPYLHLMALIVVSNEGMKENEREMWETEKSYTQNAGSGMEGAIIAPS